MEPTTLFQKKMKFYDVRLKNYVVLFARQGRGLNHSGGNSEGRPSLGEGGGVLRISSDGDD